jgi:hypothetical protein
MRRTIRHVSKEWAMKRVPMLSLVMISLIACGGSSGKRSSSKLELTSATFVVNEASGTASVTVSRTGLGKAVASVDYTTVDMTATGGIDYTVTAGTLSWASGDRSDKTITIPLVDDALVEGDETLEVTISNPGGDGALGAVTSATITIQDDDPLSCGPLDPAFGAGGAITSDPSPSQDNPWNVAVDGSAIYVIGAVDYAAPQYDTRWRIEKYAIADGAPVTTFGGAGGVESDPTTGNDRAVNIVLDAAHLYVVGWGGWRIEKRALMDGAYDPGFGNLGVVTGDPTATARGIVLSGAHIIVVGFDDSLGSQQLRIEKRLATDGTLEAAFGTGGVETDDPTVLNDRFEDVVADSTHLYAAGWEGAGSGDSAWRIEKRLLTDGSLDAAFGTLGAVTVDPSIDDDRAHTLVVNGTHLFVAGIDRAPGFPEWRVEKRLITDGAPDAGFGAGGVHISTATPWSMAEALGIAIDATHLYIACHDTSPGDDQWWMERRLLTDGSGDPCFGTGGVITSNPSGNNDRAFGMAIDSTSIYVVGRDESTGGQVWRLEKRLK